jgi:hypothetical protein
MKRITLLLLVALTSAAAFGQKDVDESTGWSLKERAYLGLGFGGLGLGTNSVYGKYFSIGLTPMAGYMLTKDLSTGLAFEYQYTSYSDLKIKVHQYGWYPFVRYNIKDFFIQADYDWYSIQQDITNQESDRIVLDRFFVGAGYSSRGGGRAAVNFLVSYDLLYTNTSMFSSPVSIRIFMTF